MNKWIKLLLIILGFAIFSVAIYFILKLFGITNISTLQNIILNNKNLSGLIYIVITAILLTLLCFVPLLNTSLIVLGIVLFGPLNAFILSLIATLLSNSILFFIGDKFGEAVARKVIGKKDLELAQDFVDNKSKILLPLLFVLPGFPDEALCIVAGMTKMKFWYLILVSTIYHSLEIGLFCFFGSGLINWSTLTIIDWFLLINVILIDLYFLFKLEKSLKNNKK